MSQAIKLNDQDNVATALKSIQGGMHVLILPESKHRQLVALSHIPEGHKIAVEGIKKGEMVRKYGHVIGRATSDIEKGEHVHIHNIESLRGRGDL